MGAVPPPLGVAKNATPDAAHGLAMLKALHDKLAEFPGELLPTMLIDPLELVLIRLVWPSVIVDTPLSPLTAKAPNIKSLEVATGTERDAELAADGEEFVAAVPIGFARFTPMRGIRMTPPPPPTTWV
jgi:hypothetical protein